jgi:hypothetical protein
MAPRHSAGTESSVGAGTGSPPTWKMHRRTPDSLPFIRLPVCQRRLKRPGRDYVTSPNIRRTSIR